MNQDFRDLIDKIIKEKSIKMKGIEKLSGISYNRIINIKRDKAQANELDFIKLYRAFPEYQLEGLIEGLEKESIEERVERLEKENEEMKRTIFRVLENQNKILSDKD